MAAGFDTRTAQSIHEVAHREPLPDALGGILLAARVEHDDTFGHKEGCERYVGRDGDVSGRRVLGDVCVGNVGPSVDTHCREMPVPDGKLHPLIRDENRGKREPLGCPDADVLHVTRRGVRIDPECQRRQGLAPVESWSFTRFDIRSRAVAPAATGGHVLARASPCCHLFPGQPIMRQSAVLFLATLLAVNPLVPRRASAQRAFAPDRVARIDRVLKESVDSNRIAGAVALVLHDGKVAYQRAVGFADREAGRRMSSDAIFRIASQTKAITSVAAMILVEEGRLTLNSPVSRYIPTFARTTVVSRTDTGRTIAPARRAITIFDLLTHTAGISYGTDGIVSEQYAAAGLGPAAGWGWYTADKDEPVCTTMERLGSLPFVAQPGQAWVYGYNTDILGCVIERASGMPLDEFIRTRITGPLGMNDTHFFLPPAKRARLATVYMSDSTGRAVRAPDGARGQGHYVDGPRRNFAGGAGMVSTAGDYARFLQMLLGGGVLGTTRILSARSVELMSTNQVGTQFNDRGQGFGLGFQTTDRLGADGYSSVGSYGWGGAYATTYRVDPKEKLVMVFMVQMLPNRSDVAAKFPTLVYQALVDTRK